MTPRLVLQREQPFLHPERGDTPRRSRHGTDRARSERHAQRRMVTKGQLAMIAVHAGLQKFCTQEELASKVGVPQPRIAQALAVQRYAPELVIAIVKAGQVILENPATP